MKNKVLFGSIFVAFCSLIFYLTSTARLENAKLKVYGGSDAKVTQVNSNDNTAVTLSPDSLKKTKSSNSSLAKTIIKNVDNATSPVQLTTQNIDYNSQFATVKNTNEAQDVSAVLKLFVLIAYEKEGKSSQTFKVNNEDVKANDQSLQAGTAYSGAFLKDLMMRQNNNDAANILLNAMGKEKINAVTKNIGASHTKITGKFGEEKVGQTTAADLELVLKKLYQGKIKNSNEDNQVLGLLLNFPEKGLAAQVNGTVYRISDKHASVALVQANNGKTYVMSSVSGQDSVNFEKLGTAINSWYESH